MNTEQQPRAGAEDRFFKRPFSFLTTPGTRQNRGNRGGTQRPKCLKLSLDAG